MEPLRFRWRCGSGGGGARQAFAFEFHRISIGEVYVTLGPIGQFSENPVCVLTQAISYPPAVAGCAEEKEFCVGISKVDSTYDERNNDST